MNEIETIAALCSLTDSHFIRLKGIFQFCDKWGNLFWPDVCHNINIHGCAQHTVNNAGHRTTDYIGNPQFIQNACYQQRNLKGFGIGQVVSPLGRDWAINPTGQVFTQQDRSQPTPHFLWRGVRETLAQPHQS